MSQTTVHQPIPQCESDNPAEEITAEQVNRQVESLLDSKHFRQAKSLEKFLRYVVAKRLAREEDDLKEYTIGLEVFQRGAEFDPRKDAVVRVQANVLRKRLASYYDDEGLLDEIVIEIPKGHYVPQFHRRSLKTDLVVVSEPVGAAVSAETSELVMASPNSTGSRWKMLGQVAAIFVLGLATALVWQNWLGKPAATGKDLGKAADANKAANVSVDPAYLTLWEKFLEPGVENILAYGTPQFFVSSGLYLRDVEVNSPQDSEAATRLKLLQRSMRAPFRPTEIYTGVGETHGVYLLTKFFNRMPTDLRVTRSRMVGWNEMKNANIVFLSSMRFHTLAKELPYPTDFTITSGMSSQVVNLHPRAGESETYGGGEDEVYSVITVWPGKLHQRRVLVLSGSTTWATLATAEYATDPEYLRQLNHHLEQCRAKSGREKHSPFFQVLLRAEVKDNQPISIGYVTHHDLDIPDVEPAPSSSARGQKIARLVNPQR